MLDETDDDDQDHAHEVKDSAMEGILWACGECTYENEPFVRDCAVCGVPKDGSCAGMQAMQACIQQRANERAKNRAHKRPRPGA